MFTEYDFHINLFPERIYEIPLFCENILNCMYFIKDDKKLGPIKIFCGEKDYSHFKVVKFVQWMFNVK